MKEEKKIFTWNGEKFDLTGQPKDMQALYDDLSKIEVQALELDKHFAQVREEMAQVRGKHEYVADKLHTRFLELAQPKTNDEGI